MKIKNILAGVLALAAVSCSNKKDVEQGSTYSQQALFYSFKDGVKTQASINNAISVSATRADVGSVQNLQFMTSLAKINTAKDSTTFTISPAPEEVTKYNLAHGTKYTLLPDSLVNLTKSLTVDSGVVSSNIGTIGFKIVDAMANNQPYLYAIKISPNVGGVPISVGTQTLIYQVQKSVPVVNTSLVLTRDLYLKVENTGSTVADIGTTFTMEGLVYMDQFRTATDVGDAQISTFMGTEGKTLMRFGDAGINGNQLQANGRALPDPFNTKQWYHIALVVNGNTSTVYVNGAQKLTFAASGSLGEFYVGRSYGDNRGMWGRVAELRLWNVAKTAQEIKDNMMGVGSGAAGLYAYWKMSNIKDNKIPDETGKGRDLSLWGQGADKSRKTIKLYNEPAEVTIK